MRVMSWTCRLQGPLLLRPAAGPMSPMGLNSQPPSKVPLASAMTQYWVLALSCNAAPPEACAICSPVLLMFKEYVFSAAPGKPPESAARMMSRGPSPLMGESKTPMPIRMSVRS